MTELTRCAWPGADPLMIEYHDTEWGVPLHDDRKIFEFLVLDGAQAGLSWQTILRKRENYRRALDNFEPAICAGYGEDKLAALLLDEGIVRNRLKVHSVVTNARAFLEVQREFGSFDAYLWGFVEGKPVQNAWPALRDIPAKTPLSDRVSKDLKKRGFTFVGSTIVYAFMQGMGMVNDHVAGCFRHAEVQRLA